MAKYTMYQPKQPQNPAKKPIHPIWRGIGCLLLVIIPVISYFVADFLLSNSSYFKWIVIPQELVVKYSDPLILVKLLYTAIGVAILYLLLTVITFAINKFFGPERYGPYDIPPDKVQKR